MPFRFHLAVDTLPSGLLQSGGSRSVLAISSFRLRARLDVFIPSTLSGQRGYEPRFWIWRPSFERQRDFNPPEQCVAQRTCRFADHTAIMLVVPSEHGACDLIHAVQKPMFKPQYQLVVLVKSVRSEDLNWLVQWENDISTQLGPSVDVDGHDFGSGEFNIFILARRPHRQLPQGSGVCRNASAAQRDGRCLPADRQR